MWCGMVWTCGVVTGANRSDRFDYYKCRLAGADCPQISCVALLVLISVGLLRRLMG